MYLYADFAGEETDGILGDIERRLLIHSSQFPRVKAHIVPVRRKSYIPRWPGMKENKLWSEPIFKDSSCNLYQRIKYY